MDILIKKEVLEEYVIDTSELLLCIDTLEVYQLINEHEIEHLYKIKWKTENETIIIYKEKEENK